MKFEKIKRFHKNLKKSNYQWKNLSIKQMKIDTREEVFISLNRLRRRIIFKSLRDYCVEFLPAHVWNRVLNLLILDRVSAK